MLDLVRLGSRRLFPPGGEDLYRQVALLTELAPGMECLDVACGRGIALEYFVREFGVQGSGVDTDPHFIAEAEAFSRKEGLVGEMSFQEASPGDLPFRDETFDVVVGELGLAATVDPREAVRELVRVTRPGGQIVLIQLVWIAPVEEDRRQILSAHLGARPLMVVELRRVLMDAGIEEILVEDWTNDETAFRPQVKMPFPEFAELFTLWEKLGILFRAWRRWGWRGVRTVFQRKEEVHGLLTRERLLGLNLLKGVKAEALREEPVEAPDAKEQGAEEDGDLEAPELPLFGGEAERNPSSS